jgi:hypothetical protein
MNWPALFLTAEGGPDLPGAIMAFSRTMYPQVVVEERSSLSSRRWHLLLGFNGEHGLNFTLADERTCSWPAASPRWAPPRTAVNLSRRAGPRRGRPVPYEESSRVEGGAPGESRLALLLPPGRGHRPVGLVFDAGRSLATGCCCSRFVGRACLVIVILDVAAA